MHLFLFFFLWRQGCHAHWGWPTTPTITQDDLEPLRCLPSVVWDLDCLLVQPLCKAPGKKLRWEPHIRRAALISQHGMEALAFLLLTTTAYLHTLILFLSMNIAIGSVLVGVLWNKRTCRMNIYIFLCLCLSLPLTLFLLAIFMRSLCVSLFLAPLPLFPSLCMCMRSIYYKDVEVNATMGGYEQKVHKSSRCDPLRTSISADLQCLSNSQKYYR